MDDPFVLIVHGFEGFGRDAIKAGCFPLLEYGNGTFDFVEGDWGVDFGEAWLLGNEFKDGVIDWSVVLYQAMRAESQRRIRMVIKIAGEPSVLFFIVN